MSGGSLMIRRRPPTTSVSFVLGLERVLGARLRHDGGRLGRHLRWPLAAFDFCLPAWAREAGDDLLDVDVGVPHVEVARLGQATHLLPVRRPDRPSRPTAQSFLEKLWSRPAMTTLAARRLRSHSQGPGSVSSKSLTSNIIERSGDAKSPKLLRCASPQIWVVRPDAGVVARSDAMISAAPR